MTNRYKVRLRGPWKSEKDDSDVLMVEADSLEISHSGHAVFEIFNDHGSEICQVLAPEVYDEVMLLREKDGQ